MESNLPDLDENGCSMETLSDKRVICSKALKGHWYSECRLKEFFNEFLKESWTTHSCPDEDDDFECHCGNDKIEDQNCLVISKEKFYKLIGDKLI